MSRESAGVLAAAGAIEVLDYWTARKKAGELRDYLQGECPLEDRPATLGSLAMLEKHISNLSADEPRDTSLDAVNAYAQVGEFRRASEALKESGVDTTLEITEESKSHHKRINKQKAERVPQIMEQFNISEDDAIDWFDKNESMSRWGRPAIEVKQ